jgi:hypothetical protein
MTFPLLLSAFFALLSFLASSAAFLPRTVPWLLLLVLPGSSGLLLLLLGTI